MGLECEHPFKSFGYDFVVPTLEGDFVNLDQGTGIVHIAPGTWCLTITILGIKEWILISVQTVEDDGIYNDHAKRF